MELELMSPAGSFESLGAAIKAGADSIYFGVETLNMRAGAQSFKESDIGKICSICRENGVKAYLTLNSVMYDQDLEVIRRILAVAKKSGVAAVIAHDIAVLQLAQSVGMEIHMSTQANISNFEAVRFYSKFATVIVLARELSLEQVRCICKSIQEKKVLGPDKKPIRIEVFVHGALCVSISGKCYMSLASNARSANRGICIQNCRRRYSVKDEWGNELDVGNGYIMSPKDLCTIGIIDKLVSAGVSVFKIEGRARGPEYVFKTTKAYKEALLAAKDKTFLPEKVKRWTSELESVYNRGFWQDGYYLGKKLGEWSSAPGSVSKKEVARVGRVDNYFRKNSVAEVVLDSSGLDVGEDAMITGPTTGCVMFNIEAIKDGKDVKSAKKGKSITIKVPEKVRKNDVLYALRLRKV